MGNDLYITHKEKIIANVGRKHNFTYPGEYELPSEERLERELAEAKGKLIGLIISYATWLSARPDDEDYAEQFEEIYEGTKDAVDLFEDECSIAHRNFLLKNIEENDYVEILDDGDLEKRRQWEIKKEKRMKELREQCLKYRMAAAIKETNYDAVEHQTSEVDLEDSEYQFDDEGNVGC